MKRFADLRHPSFPPPKKAFKMGLSYPSWMEWYKKPSWVDVKEFSREASSRRSSDSCIPPKLSLERILKNETCTSVLPKSEISYSVQRVVTDVFSTNR